MFKKIRNFIMSLFYKEKRIPRDDSEKRSNFIGVQSSDKNDKNTLRVEQHPGFTRVINLSPSASPALLHSPKLSDAEYQARRQELMGIKLNEDGTDPAVNTGYENHLKGLSNRMVGESERRDPRFINPDFILGDPIDMGSDEFRRGAHTVTSEPIPPNELDIDMSKFAEVADAVIFDRFKEALINGHSGHPIFEPEALQCGSYHDKPLMCYRPFLHQITEPNLTLIPETDIHINQVKKLKVRFEDLSKNEKRKMSPRRIKKETKKVIKPTVGKHR